MKVNFLMRSVWFCVLLVSFGVAQGQTHFIYIQTDDKAPFAATVDSKSYTSSNAGYLLVPQLAEGDHTLIVTMNNEPGKQQNFTVPVKKKDAGYGLKKYGGDGWGLYSLTSSDVIMAQSASVESSTVATEKDTSSPVTGTAITGKKTAFGEMLSQVVDDPDLTKPTEIVYHPNKKQKAAPKTENAVNKVDSAAPVNNDEVASQPTIDDTTTITDDTATATASAPANQLNDNEDNLDKVADAARTSGVIKASEESDDTGRTMVFIDFNSTGSDTIEVTIPSENAVASSSDDSNKVDTTAVVVAKDTEALGTLDSSATLPAQQPKEEDTQVTTSVKPGKKEIDNPFYKADEKPAVSDVTTTADQPNTEPKKLTLTNSTCTKMLSDNDVDKLRRKMFTEAGYENMIDLAKKFVKGKCVTTSQVKDLSQLFLTDESRYNFFDAMYSNVLDYQSYTSLESQLLDSYYKNRLKALIH